MRELGVPVRHCKLFGSESVSRQKRDSPRNIFSPATAVENYQAGLAAKEDPPGRGRTLEPDGGSEGNPQFVLTAVVEIDFIADIDTHANKTPQRFLTDGFVNFNTTNGPLTFPSPAGQFRDFARFRCFTKLLPPVPSLRVDFDIRL
jgi:hypothetical protein